MITCTISSFSVTKGQGHTDVKVTHISGSHKCQGHT